MDSDILALKDAALQLGVSSERVRQMIHAGELPGVRIGNAWAVPARDVHARRAIEVHHGGRPFSEKRAWAEILSGPVDPHRAGRYRRRARVIAAEFSAASFDWIIGQVPSMVSGVRAAIELGEPLAHDERADIYVASSGLARIRDEVPFVESPFGQIRLRIVADAIWPIIHLGPIAPRRAIGLDLLESADPRHRIAGERLLADD